MYVYFDGTGTIKEIVNDDKIRQGSANVNKLYFYFEDGSAYTNMTISLKFNNGDVVNDVNIYSNITAVTFPETSKDLNYFVEGRNYTMYYYTLSLSDLAHSGLTVATVKAYTGGTIAAQGLLTFDIENSVIMTSTDITYSDFEYLQQLIASTLQTVYVNGTLQSITSRITGLVGGVEVLGEYALNLGKDSIATQNFGISLGANSQVTSTYGIGLGVNVVVSGTNGMAIGRAAECTNSNGIAIGGVAESNGMGAIAFGYNAKSINAYDIAIGNRAKASGSYSGAIGEEAEVTGMDSMSYGYKAKVTSQHAIQLGQGTNASDNSLQFRSRKIIDYNASRVGQEYSFAILSGGITRQVLAKKSNTDYDYEWVQAGDILLDSVTNTLYSLNSDYSSLPNDSILIGDGSSSGADESIVFGKDNIVSVPSPRVGYPEHPSLIYGNNNDLTGANTYYNLIYGNDNDFSNITSSCYGNKIVGTTSQVNTGYFDGNYIFGGYDGVSGRSNLTVQNNYIFGHLINNTESGMLTDNIVIGIGTIGNVNTVYSSNIQNNILMGNGTINGSGNVAIGNGANVEGNNYGLVNGAVQLGSGTNQDDFSLQFRSRKVIDYNAARTEQYAMAVKQGGTTNQVLAKASNTDYDYKWMDMNLDFLVDNAKKSIYTSLSNDNYLGNYSIEFGYEAQTTGDYSNAMGYQASATGDYSSALGYKAVVSVDNAIQLGEGTNSQANTFQVGNIVLADLSTNKMQISLSSSIDPSTYVMTLNLIGKYYDTVNELYKNITIDSTSIDLPLETMVVGGYYDDENKKLVLSLNNGTSIDIPVSDLISGLATSTDLTNLANRVTTIELNYVSSSDLTTTLSSYVTSSSLTSTLSSYVTSSDLTSTLSSYVTSSDLTTELASYVTSTDLSTTLGSYVTSTDLSTTLSGYVQTSTLSSYVTSSDLTTTLSDYITTSSLSTELSNYVTSSTLSSTLATYVTSSDLSTTLLDYVAKTDLSGGTEGQVLTKNSSTDGDYSWQDPTGGGGTAGAYCFTDYINTNTLPVNPQKGDVYISNSDSPLVFTIGGGSGFTSFRAIQVNDTFPQGGYVYFDNTISDADMLTFLQGLTYVDGTCDLVTCEDENNNTLALVTAINMNVSEDPEDPQIIYALSCYTTTDDSVVWVNDGSSMGMTSGWQPLDQDGGLLLNFPDGEQTLTVTTLSNVVGWNGTMVKYGDIVNYKIFETNDTCTQMKFDTTLNVAAMEAIIDDLTFTDMGEGEYMATLLTDTDGNTVLYAIANDMGGGDYAYALGSGDYLLWINIDIGEVPVGWNTDVIDQDGIFDTETSVIIDDVNQSAIWNGIFAWNYVNTEPTEITLNKGDWLTYNGHSWDKVDNQEYASVSYVNSIVGDISTILESLVTVTP